GALERICATHRIRLHHIKLHGSLYHLTEQSEVLARGYLAAVRRWFPKLIIYARAGGRVATWARQFRVMVWDEAFADRAYCEDGSLVSRDEPCAVISNPTKIARRVDALTQRGVVESTGGGVVRMAAKTLCVHSDTANAVQIATLCRKVIGAS